MLTRVDRVVVAVPDRNAAAKGWKDLLGAQEADDDRVECLAALRTRLRLGDGWVEMLEPDGAGPVADALEARDGRGHLVAGGMATDDLDALTAHLKDRGVDAPAEGGQLFIGPEHTGGMGLRVVISQDERLDPVGDIDTFYETTNLVHDADAAVRHYSELFGLGGKAFQAISSDEYGYTGTLTLLDDDTLDRFEVITPEVPENTMGRYFSKFGESLYMCFAETGQLPEIEARCIEAGAGHTRVPSRDQRDGPPDTVFLHPSALGGMMLGLSRRTVAWVWSGHPERVVPWQEQVVRGDSSE